MNITPSVVISEIETAIRAIEGDLLLFDEINFNARADAIDFIEFHIIDRIDGQRPDPINRELAKLKRRAETIKSRLENINTGMHKRLREKIRNGGFPYTSFSKMIGGYLGIDVSVIVPSDTIGYDNLDVFINGLLCEQALPEATIKPLPGMVFYQQTPARIIMELAQLAQLTPDDVFFDIGSGLGQVVLLVHLMTGAPVKGIEYEPAYCNYARACASSLNLPDVEFINADARYCDYHRGTVFFMYTPFERDMTQEMLDVLSQESLKRPIRIFTYGPCSAFMARQSWLRCVNGMGEQHYRLYEFRRSL